MCITPSVSRAALWLSALKDIKSVGASRRRLHSSTARVQLSNAPSAALPAHLLGNRAWTRVRLGSDEIRGEAEMDGAREEFVGT